MTPGPDPLVEISAAQRARESAHANAVEEAERWAQRETRRMAWQCVGLTFLGVPIYLWSWSLTDGRQAAVVATGALVISYVAPFFRWLFFHLKRVERGDA